MSCPAVSDSASQRGGQARRGLPETGRELAAGRPGVTSTTEVRPGCCGGQVSALEVHDAGRSAGNSNAKAGVRRRAAGEPHG